MPITQFRLPQKMLNEINELVRNGIYTSKSDVVRDALRRLLLEKMIGVISSSKNSVKEVREIRKKLSREKTDLNEINGLIK